MSEIIKLLNVVDFQVNAITGVVTAPVTHVEGSDDVFSKVNIRVCDSAHLNAVVSGRRRGERACLAKGTRFCGAFAVGDSELPNLLKELAAIQKGVLSAKQDIISNWDKWVKDWAAKHPSESAEILLAAPSAASLQNSIGASIRVYKVQTQLDALAAAGVEDGLLTEAGGLAVNIAREIAQAAKDAWKGEAFASQRIRNPLAKIRDKAKSLQFIDKRLLNVVDLIDTALATMPREGKIEGRDYLALSGLFGVLSQPDLLLSGRKLELMVEQEELPLEISTADDDDESLVANMPPPSLSVGTTPAYAW